MHSKTWQLFGVAGAIAVLAYQLLPLSFLTGFGLYDGLAFASAILIAVAARGREHRGAWYCLAAAQASYFVGDVTYDVWLRQLGTEPPVPGLPDVFYLAVYPLLALGLGGLVRARTAGRDTTGRLDALILTIAFGAFAWAFLMEPYAADATLSLPAKAVLIAYPLMDVLVLGVALRLMAGAGERPPAFFLLLAAMLLQVGVDIVYGLQMLSGTFDNGSWMDAGWMASYVLLGMAALHPSAVSLTRPVPVTGPRITRARLIVLAIAAVLTPTLAAASSGGSRLVLIAAVFVLFVLCMVRGVGVIRTLEHSLDTVAELHRRSGERRFRSLVQNAVDGVLILDADGRVTFSSPSIQTLLGQDVHGCSSSELLELVHDDDRERLVTHLTGSTPGRSTSLQARVRGVDGGLRHLEITVTDLQTDPDVQGVVVNAHDVTERMKLEEQLRRLAFHDPLTGLANRALFGDRVQHALARVRRSGRWVGVLFCDLDEFKTVNDSLGHHAGDALLRVVAERLVGCLRPGDTAGRLGGDEFGVLLEDLDDPDEASAIADRVLAALRQPWVVDGQEVTPACSIGIAIGTGSEETHDLLRDADTAMYEAKRRGKNGWQLYRPLLRAEALNRLQLKADLSHALARGELRLVYQPIVSLEGGHTTGVEALLRWEHPTRGPVAPGDFIPLAEETGDIIPLGRWVLHEACRQARAWRDDLPEAAGWSMSVNLSARQLADPDLVPTVIAALEQSGLEPEALVLELTESVLVDDPQAALSTFHELKQLGVRLAIDDFGTGYSSLSYLQHLPVDIIKIDKTFVDDLGDGLARAALARGIVELTRTLGATAVAEGIESPAQVDDLRELQCSHGQGFLFSRPMVAADLVAAERAPAERRRPATTGAE